MSARRRRPSVETMAKAALWVLVIGATLAVFGAAAGGLLTLLGILH